MMNLPQNFLVSEIFTSAVVRLVSWLVKLCLAQAVSHRLPTAVAARVPAQIRSRGICGGQSDTVAGFL
jgi:hypothetical protein